jgi:peroxiredoxin
MNELPPEVHEVIANSILAHAQGGVVGLPIGRRAPDFTLLNDRGVPVHLYERLARGPVVLCFFRGEWCPFCQREMVDLKRALPQIVARGASLVCVHPQRLDVSQRMGEPVRDGFDVCQDELMNVLAAYDVKFELVAPLVALYRDRFALDLAALNANGQWNLPVPATFIIDRDRTIKARQFSHDFTVRVDPSYILAALDALPESSPELVEITAQAASARR